MALKSHQIQMPRPPAFDEILGAALSFAKYDGIPVFACCPQTKKPFTANGFKDATTDEQLIEKMWQRWPAAMIGMPTGPASSRWVLDIDVKDGRDGRATARRARARAWRALPPTLITLTPSGGEHRYFRWQEEHPIGSRVAARRRARYPRSRRLRDPSAQHARGWRLLRLGADVHRDRRGAGLADRTLREETQFNCAHHAHTKEPGCDPIQQRQQLRPRRLGGRDRRPRRDVERWAQRSPQHRIAQAAPVSRRRRPRRGRGRRSPPAGLSR